MCISSPSNASALPGSLIPHHHHPKHEVIKQFKNQPHLAVQSFSVAGPHWAGPMRRLQHGQMSESPVPPDQTTWEQNSSSEPFPLVSGNSRVGQNQPLCRWGKGNLPCTQSGQDSSSFSGHTFQSLSCSLPKVLPENKRSLRFPAGCTGQTPLLAPSSATWPLLRRLKQVRQ